MTITAAIITINTDTTTATIKETHNNDILLATYNKHTDNCYWWTTLYVSHYNDYIKCVNEIYSNLLLSQFGHNVVVVDGDITILVVDIKNIVDEIGDRPLTCWWVNW